jgi:hypothetical protein
MGPRALTHPKKESFVRKHSRGFAVVGAVVVLMTFVVKEIFQEKLKEIKDSIAEAQHIEEIAGPDERMSLNEVAVRLKLRQMQTQIAAQRIGGDVPGQDVHEAISEAYQSSHHGADPFPTCLRYDRETSWKQ